MFDSASRDYLAIIHVDMCTRGVVVAEDGVTAFVTGNYCETAANGDVVKVDLRSRKVVQRRALGRRPRAVALTEDGSTVLVGRYGRIDMLASTDLRRLGSIPIGRRDSTFLAVRRNRAISIDSTRRMRVLDLTRRHVLSRPKLVPVAGAVFTPGGRHIRAAVGASSPRLVTLRADTGERAGRKAWSTGGARGGVALSCDGRVAYVAPGRSDHYLVAIDLETGHIRHRLWTVSGPFVPVLGPDNLLYFTGGNPHTYFVRAYLREPLRRQPSLWLGEEQRPFGLALTEPACPPA